MRFGRHLADFFVQIVGKPEAAKIDQRGVRSIQNTHDNTLAIHRWQRETRRSISLPSTFSLMRPFCRNRRLAMFRFALNLMREMIAAGRALGGGSIFLST